MPLKTSISDPLIVCYREIHDPKRHQRNSDKVEKLSLKQQLSKHFESFSIPSINLLQESTNPPKIVTRLLQRQEENASAINHERDLICSSNDVIKTKFIVFWICYVFQLCFLSPFLSTDICLWHLLLTPHILHIFPSKLNVLWHWIDFWNNIRKQCGNLIRLAVFFSLPRICIKRAFWGPVIWTKLSSRSLSN